MNFILSNIKYFKVIILLVICFSSCTEEFDLFNDDLKLTSDYEEVAAVYANICPQNDTNYLRINRGFAVNNFYTTNLNSDSIYFNPEDIQVFAHKIKGDDTLFTYNCKDTLMLKDSVGDFPTDKVLLYYFISNNLLNDNEQDIDFGLTIRTQDQNVSSKTDLVRAAVPTNPGLSYFDFTGSTYRYSVYSFRGTQKIQARGICSFYERRLVGNHFDTVKMTFDFPVGKNIYADPLLIDYYRHEYGFGIGLLTLYLERAINNYGDIINTDKRWLGKIKFEILCGNADQVLFESFNNSITTGLSEEPITYSNIENGVGFLTSYSKSYSRQLLFTRKASDSIGYRMRDYFFEY